MRLLHTSDWHLGRSLYGRRRHAEFDAFLDWLADTLLAREIEVLLIAGDVFDTNTPGNRAQSQYYRFLCRVAASPCRHVVVIAGNHDSPTFLDAPRELLRALNVHVIGEAADPADEVLVLRDARGEAELIVCAVPYLRDRDTRSAEAGESMEDKARKRLAGLREHYAAVGEAARAAREAQGGRLPIVGMGHLFAAGGHTLDGDGVRDLYVGSLAHVSAEAFPDCFDYLALGHLHVPQSVGGRDHFRYCGSPLPMGFGEAGQQKQVLEITVTADASPGERAQVRPIDIPVFQQLVRLRGDWPRIERELRDLVAAGVPVWVEVYYEGEEIAGDLREQVATAVSDSEVEVLRIRNRRVMERALQRDDAAQSLDELDERAVFERCLSAHQVPEGQRGELRALYAEILTAMDESDVVDQSEGQSGGAS
jgi:exonuclease SbcD